MMDDDPMRRRVVAIVSILGIAGAAASGQSKEGSICIAPVRLPATTSAPNGIDCTSGTISVRIDRSTVPWPQGKESRAIDHLDLAARHRVTVLCDGKPQSSFSFRFSTFDSRRLCLFINDLYQTPQLWGEGQRAPWCTCAAPPPG